MGKNIARKGEMSTGHEGFPPRPNYEGSDDVFINGRPVHREGDKWFPHSEPNGETHDGVLAKGSGTVFINGKGCGRIGDKISCNDNILTGSENVFAGD